MTTDPPAPSSPQIGIERRPNGGARVGLSVDGKRVSGLFIVPFTLRIGAAAVRMEGIGGVETDQEHRRRGYARRVLEAAVQAMREGEAALSMLYGIADFYPKFGYATAGPEHSIEITGPFHDASLHPGWRVRPFETPDLPAIRLLYDRNTERGTGAAVRSPEAGPWRKLASTEGRAAVECRVVEDPEGAIRAYAWRARGHWYVEHWERREPDAMIIAEAMADGPAAAEAVLVACRRWAADESAQRPEPVKRVIFSLPPEGPVAAAAMYQGARFSRYFQRCGGSMVRLLDVARLLEALQPELADRLRTAGWPFSGIIRFRTEIGEAALVVSREGLAVAGENEPSRSGKAARAGEEAAEIVIRLPQSELARLALGAFPPEDLLARLEEPPEEPARRLISMLFPLRHPHMYLPDRF